MQTGISNIFARYRVALLSGVSAMVMSTTGAFAQEAIRIGIVTPKQGPSAALGTNMAQGADLAVAERGGRVMDRPVETIWLDEASPQIAQQNMQKLSDEYNVAGVVGGNSSAATLAMMSVAEREKIPFISAGSAASEVTGISCNRYTFRTQAPAPVQISAVFDELKGKKLYFFTPAYAFGQDVLRTGREKLASIDATEVGNDEVPVATADYSSYILKIRKSQPDAIFGALVGLDLSNFMKQWNEMGMKGQIPIYEVAVSDTDFWDIGPAAATGTHVKPWYYNDPNNPEREKAFAEAYQAKYGQPPSDKAFFGWFSMNALLDAIEAAGSTEPQKVVPALEGWHYPDGTFPYFFRDFDHQLIRPSLIVRLKDPITEKWDFMDVVMRTTPDRDAAMAAFGTQEQIGCKMGDL